MNNDIFKLLLDFENSNKVMVEDEPYYKLKKYIIYTQYNRLLRFYIHNSLNARIDSFVTELKKEIHYLENLNISFIPSREIRLVYDQQKNAKLPALKEELSLIFRFKRQMEEEVFNNISKKYDKSLESSSLYHNLLCDVKNILSRVIVDGSLLFDGDCVNLNKIDVLRNLLTVENRACLVNIYEYKKMYVERLNFHNLFNDEENLNEIFMYYLFKDIQKKFINEKDNILKSLEEKSFESDYLYKKGILFNNEIIINNNIISDIYMSQKLSSETMESLQKLWYFKVVMDEIYKKYNEVVSDEERFYYCTLMCIPEDTDAYLENFMSQLFDKYIGCDIKSPLDVVNILLCFKNPFFKEMDYIKMINFDKIGELEKCIKNTEKSLTPDLINVINSNDSKNMNLLWLNNDGKISIYEAIDIIYILNILEKECFSDYNMRLYLDKVINNQTYKLDVDDAISTIFDSIKLFNKKYDVLIQNNKCLKLRRQ